MTNRSRFQGTIAGVDRRLTFVGGLLALVLLLSGWLADGLLRERRAAAEALAVTEAEETARLGAMTLRATLAQLELSMVAGEPREEILWERLAPPVSNLPSSGPRLAYSRRSAGELVSLLESDELSPNKLPEAVVAALELSRRDAPNAALRKETVASRLLQGLLPVHPRDLPGLVELLGTGSDARVTTLRATLENAPPIETLPDFPDLFRRPRVDSVDGWSRQGSTRLHYTIPLNALLAASGVSDRLHVASALSVIRAPVPEVQGLVVAVETPRAVPDGTGLTRLGLWASIGLAAIALFAVLGALKREESAVQREKRFLANVTHELRTPLAAIRVFGETLVRGRGDPVEYGELIAKETERLAGLIDRVLTVTRIDEAPRLTRVKPKDIAEDSVSLLKQRAAVRKVELELKAENLATAVWDEDAVRRALINLLENAIQHGGAGGRVTLTAETENGSVRFSVSDQGPGIQARDRKRVFGRFERGATEGPGSGLGLYVVEQVARAHGGQVELETAPGEGCRFALTLPVEPRVHVGDENA